MPVETKGLGASLRARMRPIAYFEREAQPDPAPEPLICPIISVDDHVFESAVTFAGRLPAKFVDAAPRIIRHAEGADAWLFEGCEPELILSSNSAISWRIDHRDPGVVRVDDMRAGTYDAKARIADMDREGIWASQLFPSVNFGFAGQRLTLRCDPEPGLAYMRAWNDWIHDEYATAYPERFIAAQLTYLPDVDLAAKEVRRNAERGFRSVLFSENPEKLGLPSIHSGYWDPFFEACQETETVVLLHLGSSSDVILPSSDSPADVVEVSIRVNPILAVVDWMFSRVPLRFPKLSIHISEGGIDWVPLVHSYLRNQERQHPVKDWPVATPPSDVLFRNFYYAGLWDAVAWDWFAELAPDQVSVEVDYPHSDTTFPRSQSYFANCLRNVSDDAFEKIMYKNAARLFRHPLPAAGWLASCGDLTSRV